MASQEQDPIVLHASDSCDESKCVSKGRSNLYERSFTCYGNNFLFPMMCADGYLPVVLDDEPSLNHTDWYGQFPVSYFTCCPPHYASSNSTVDQGATRQCSDPVVATNEVEVDAAVCDDQDSRKYRRQMKTARGSIFGTTTLNVIPPATDSFLCCDAPLPVTSNENFLDDLECVPYRNEFYEAKLARNVISLLRVITCDFPEGDFVYPRPLAGQTIDHALATGLYRCCKDGPALPPFVHDYTYKQTVYPLVTLWSISAIFSAFTAIALLVPLLIQLKNGTFRIKNNRRSSSIRSPNREPCYSTYNLYVVYLAITDLLYCLIQVTFHGGSINQKFNPRFHAIIQSPTDMVGPYPLGADMPISLTYVFVNNWLNAVIAYQLLALLRNSKSARRISHPSLRKVNLQAAAVFFSGMIYYLTLYFLSAAARRAGENYDSETIATLDTAARAVWYTSMYLAIAVITIIAGLIWWESLVPKGTKESTARDRAMRQLVLFFSRIVAVFYVVWIPSQVLSVVGVQKFDSKYFLPAWILMALQPVLSTCVVLTKHDVRGYMWKLMTLSYTKKDDSSAFYSSRTRPSAFKSQGLRGGTGCSTLSALTNGGAVTSTLTSATSSGAAISGASLSREVDGTSSIGDEDADVEDLCISVLGFVPYDSGDVESDVKPNGDSGTGVAPISEGGTNGDDDYIDKLKQENGTDEASEALATEDATDADAEANA